MDAILIDEVNNKINDSSNIIIDNLNNTLMYHPWSSNILFNTTLLPDSSIVTFNTNYCGLAICEFNLQKSASDAVRLYINNSLFYCNYITARNHLTMFIPIKYISNLWANSSNQNIRINTTIYGDVVGWPSNQQIIYEKDNSNIITQFNLNGTYPVVNFVTNYYGDIHMTIDTDSATSFLVNSASNYINGAFLIENGHRELDFCVRPTSFSIRTFGTGVTHSTITIYGHPLQI